MVSSLTFLSVCRGNRTKTTFNDQFLPLKYLLSLVIPKVMYAMLSPTMASVYEAPVEVLSEKKEVEELYWKLTALHATHVKIHYREQFHLRLGIPC